MGTTETTRCPYCQGSIRKKRRDSECKASWGRGHFYHLRCFNKHRENCRACWMMTGKAGR